MVNKLRTILLCYLKNKHFFMKSNSDVLVKVLWHKKIPSLETTLELKFKATELKCKAISKLHGINNAVESNEKNMDIT